jgi:hypothetical protein
MHGEELIERSPMRALAAEIRGGLDAGQVGGVFARAGVGKSAFLVQIAMTHALRGNPVLHVSLTDGQARVRSFYDELLAEVSRAVSPRDRSAAQVELERNRVIHASLGRPFGPGDLEGLVSTLAEVMHFRPITVVVDGTDIADLDVDGWRSTAEKLSLRIWMSVRIHRDGDIDVDELGSRFDSAVSLEPAAAMVQLRILRIAGKATTNTGVLDLDPVTMMVRPEDVTDPITMPPSPHPSSCTLFSGGATGAEAVFGEVAARYGLKEVNFSFEGHSQARTEGRKILDSRELAAGDVSLVYVAHRLHRHWDKTETLRKVLQTQWHVVSHATQIFVVGAIQPDGTVHGGTGWSVELAKRWNKRVWVFDQNHAGWFTWNGNSWTRGEPVIQVPDFAGSGTRFLNDAGRSAIASLFERSFGPA